MLTCWHKDFIWSGLFEVVEVRIQIAPRLRRTCLPSARDAVLFAQRPPCFCPWPWLSVYGQRLCFVVPSSPCPNVADGLLVDTILFCDETCIGLCSVLSSETLNISRTSSLERMACGFRPWFSATGRPVLNSISDVWQKSFM